MRDKPSRNTVFRDDDLDISVAIVQEKLGSPSSEAALRICAMLASELMDCVQYDHHGEPFLVIGSGENQKTLILAGAKKQPQPAA